MHAAGFDRAAQRRAGREQAALADHLVERARPHALGERAQRVAVDAQQVGLCMRICRRRRRTRRVAPRRESSAQPPADDVDALRRREAERAAGEARVALPAEKPISCAGPADRPRSMRTRPASAEAEARATRSCASSALASDAVDPVQAIGVPASLTTNSRSRRVGSISAASGLLCSSTPCARTVTCSRSGS